MYVAIVIAVTLVGYATYLRFQFLLQLPNILNGIKYESKEFTFDPAIGNENMKIILEGVVDTSKSIE